MRADGAGFCKGDWKHHIVDDGCARDNTAVSAVALHMVDLVPGGGATAFGGCSGASGSQRKQPTLMGLACTNGSTSTSSKATSVYVHVVDAGAPASETWWMLQVGSHCHGVAAARSMQQHGRPPDGHGDGLRWGYVPHIC